MSEIVRTAAALVIGNELLSGKIHEANLVELARTLRAVGVELRRAVMIPDDIEIVATEIRALSEDHDVVFTSGGVGPTHDDVTLDAVARAFGVPAEVHPDMERMLRNVYGDGTTEAHLRMALVPRGARLVSGPELRWPTVVMRNVWVLPGVPEAFRMKLAIIRDEIRGAEPFVTRAVYTKMEEAELKPLLDRVVADHPNVEVGSYPKWFDARYKTKVTFDSRSETAAEAAVSAFIASLPAGEPQTI
jgi:molybdenum cofactor synthesis domain-containing protein